MVFYNEPVQTILITCRGSAEMFGKKGIKDNIITVDWHMPASFKPPLYAISIGKDRFSLKIIQESRCFVVNFIGYSKKEEALTCGTTHGHNTDKFKATGLPKEEAEKIDCPRIGNALAYLECEVVQEIEAGDHVVFIGKILGGNHIDDGDRLFHTTGNTFLPMR